MYNKKKENLGPLSSSKQPKIGEAPMVGPNVSSRDWQPLTNSNVGRAQPPDADPNAAAAAGSDANAIEFNSREDVERVLNEKMKELPRLTSLQNIVLLPTSANFGEDLRFIAVQHGYERVMHHVANQFLKIDKSTSIVDPRLLLNKVVRKISQLPNGVTVMTEDGSVYKADYVMVSNLAIRIPIFGSQIGIQETNRGAHGS